MVTFTDSIKTCLVEKYATFSGRAPRSEFWWFQLFAAISLNILIMIAPFVWSIAAIGFFIPSLACGMRRLHDSDRSGWYLLLILVPLLGIILLIFFILRGTDGDNRFGADPLAPQTDGAPK